MEEKWSAVGAAMRKSTLATWAWGEFIFYYIYVFQSKG